jgi:hypothetical protein
MQVVRCFEDENVIHVAGKVDPVEDTDVINFELALSDITQIEKRLQRLEKGRAKTKEEIASNEVLLQSFANFAMRVPFFNLIALYFVHHQIRFSPLVIHLHLVKSTNYSHVACVGGEGCAVAHCRGTGPEHSSAGSAAYRG